MKPYRIGLYEKAMPGGLTWKEMLTAAKEAGFDWVEISIDATEERISRVYMSAEERKELINTMMEVGLPIHTMNLSALTKYALGDPDEKIRNRGMDIVTHAIDLAVDLGVRVFMIPGYDIYFGESTVETKALFLENIKKLTKVAEAAGLIVAFETMENEFMNTTGKGMKYINLVNSPYLKMYPDIGNMTNAAVLHKHDVLEDLELGRGQIAALHLKETKPGHFREIPYGTGHVDFASAIKKSYELGIRMFVTEFWYVGAEDWKKDLIDVHDRFEKLFEENFF